jgi:hypothetical protein
LYIVGEMDEQKLALFSYIISLGLSFLGNFLKRIFLKDGDSNNRIGLF